MHEQYNKRLGHEADFRVSYRFHTIEEGGRKIIPYQGYRSDFWYEHPEHSGTNQIFMIWPEFENKDGEIILYNDTSVLAIGTAKMWILVPQRRIYHRDKIKIGTIGYFMEGNRRVAECEVIEILGLLSNPTQ